MTELIKLYYRSLESMSINHKFTKGHYDLKCRLLSNIKPVLDKMLSTANLASNVTSRAKCSLLYMHALATTLTRGYRVRQQSPLFDLKTGKPVGLERETRS